MGKLNWLDRFNVWWWNQRRIVLEERVIQSSKLLLRHTGASSFLIPMDGITITADLD